MLEYERFSILTVSVRKRIPKKSVECLMHAQAVDTRPSLKGLGRGY